MSHVCARFATFALAPLSAALLLACGGGGSAPDADTLSNESAAGYAANAGVVGSDATSALDAALLTTSDLAGAAGAAPNGAADRKHALAFNSGALACAGGGTATVTVTNAATPADELNGRLDAGEVYVASFTGCRRIVGGPALNGGLTLTVDSASTNGATVTLSTSTLSVTLPRGALAFNGSTTVQRSVVAAGGGSTVTTHISSSSLVVTTQFNGRSGEFTLSNVDLTRQAAYVGTVLQSAVYSGSHTLTAVLPNLSYSYGVATQGGANFGADGLPTQGGWRITLARRWIDISVAAGLVTISVDDGKNGSVDRSFTISVAEFDSGAG